MQLKLEGMDELLNRLQNISDAPQKVMNKALEEGGDIVLKKEKEVAVRIHKSKVGVTVLKKLKVKKRKNGKGSYIDVGLRANATNSKSSGYGNSRKRATEWDKARGLWFNNWGFFHNFTGKYVSGSNWIQTAYDEIVEGAHNAIKGEILKAMDLDH